MIVVVRLALMITVLVAVLAHAAPYGLLLGAALVLCVLELSETVRR